MFTLLPILAIPINLFLFSTPTLLPNFPSALRPPMTHDVAPMMKRAGPNGLARSEMATHNVHHTNKHANIHTRKQRSKRERQESKEAKQASKQASKQMSERASEHASEQANSQTHKANDQGIRFQRSAGILMLHLCSLLASLPALNPMSIWRSAPGKNRDTW